MPKKILYESAVHQFLSAGRRVRERLKEVDPPKAEYLAKWINALVIENAGGGTMRVAWQTGQSGEHFIEIRNAKFYTRGDAVPHYQRQADAGLIFTNDKIMAANMAFFDREFRSVLKHSGIFTDSTLDNNVEPILADSDRKHAEEVFHDEWAATVDVKAIDVRKMNEACTAPEMRYIRSVLGDLKGRKLLDVGCGLGEAAVYFALLGADVTATDISPGMCGAAERLAEANGTRITTHVSAAEDLGLPASEKFDVIYTGNTLHHVDIAATMPLLLRHLKPEGMFVSWDPVAYNPVINVYRRRAMEVRTKDEHPLRLRDIRAVRTCFRESNTRWFWLSTLLIFCIMAVVQKRDPNKERYWKTIVEEGNRWEFLYKPLERLDWLLLLFPPFRPLCWNVVIIGLGPRTTP